MHVETFTHSAGGWPEMTLSCSLKCPDAFSMFFSCSCLLCVRTERPWDDQFTVKHECRNYDLYYVIKKARSSYDHAADECRQRDMTLPFTETKECLSLFVKKLAILPAWIYGEASTSNDPHAVQNGQLKSVICAKGKDNPQLSDARSELSAPWDLG